MKWERFLLERGVGDYLLIYTVDITISKQTLCLIKDYTVIIP